MRSTLYRIFFAILVVGWPTVDIFGQPQPSDCGACTCSLSGGAFNVIVVADPFVTGGGAIGSFNTIAVPGGQSYRRIAVTAGRRYRVDLCSSVTPFNTILSVHSNVSPFPVLTGVCDDDGCGVFQGHAAVLFNPTTTGNFRTHFYLATCGNIITQPVNLRVTYLGPNTIPANDEPCGATLIPSPLPNNCTTFIGSTTVAATNTTVSGLGATPLVPTSECTAPNVQYSGTDVWFQVVVPPSGLLGIETADGSLCAGALALYTTSDNTCSGAWSMVPGTGTNTGLCSIEGVNAPGGTDAGVVINAAALGIAPGSTVFIRYWERSGNENGTFQICAYDPIPPPNDNPCGSTLLTANLTCNLQQFNTNNAFALDPSITPTPALTCTGTPLGGDVWFRVVVPPSGAMTVQTTTGTLVDMAMSWYRLTSGSICGPGAIQQIGCNNNQGGGNNMPRINSQTSGIALVPGETIYIRIWNNLNTYQGTFNICVIENIPPPNDNPCGAINLMVAPTCEPITGTTESASGTPASFPGGTITGAVPACGGPVTTDVWYYVDVPTDLTAPFGIAFQTIAGILLDGAFQLYTSTGSCATSNLTLTPIGACTQGALMPNLTLNVPTITPGQRIYVRFWRQAIPDGTFAICAVRTDPVPCVGSASDPGGPTANYPNSQNVSTTYCSSKVGDVVTLTFSEFNLENNWDFLYIYDGPTIASPLVGVYTGGNSPGVVTATISVGNPSGCLTLRFTSDAIITAPGYIAKITCSTPLPVPPPGGPAPCGTFVYDPGGISANYPNNVGTVGNPVWTATYCPGSVGNVVTLHFTQFDIESGWDGLYIYDGPTTAFPPISSGNGPGIGPATTAPGAWWGNSIPDISGSLGAGGGCLTLVFVSDASVTGNWVAQVNCGPPPPPPPPPGTTCNTTFYDPGGFSNYANNVDQTWTICAPAGQVVSVNFTSFSTEANWDGLYIYDGPTIFSPQIASTNGAGIGPIGALGPGAFWGTGSPGTVISTGNCLTFRFFTDASVTRFGWTAPITCAPASPNDNPCSAGTVMLPVTPTCSYTNSNNTNASSTAGISSAGCGNYTGGDVWFRFTTPANGQVLISTQAGTLLDGAMALYSAANCAGPFTLVECDDDDGPGLMPMIDRRCSPLLGNTIYWVRMWGYGNTRGTFDICVTQGYSSTPQGDCLGAFTLCTGSPVTAGATNPGCTNDLNSGNWGCLSGGERIGSWYAFSASSAGNLGMTITPSGNNDYDFAIWGPYPAGNTMSTLCPLPAGPPKRCSFTSAYTTNAATGSYNTGMGNLNIAYNNPIYGAPGTTYTDAAVDGWVPGFAGVVPGDIFIMFVNDYHNTTAGYNVTWTMSTPNMLDCTPLPVELLALVAHPRTSTVDLTWSTASESNSSHFVVERSADGERFEQIGTVTAAGTTQSLTDYVFTDKFPLMGVQYYRLLQVDFDGTSALSNTVSAEFKRSTNVIVVPNPTRDNAELVFSEAQEEVLLIRITDSGGRIVAETRSREGVARVTLPIEKLETGTYFVRITTNEGANVAVKPFVKQ